MDHQACYLLSFDLEDVRKEIVDGMRLPDRVPHVTERLLRLLAELQIKTTFFVVGELARTHPSLIRDIVSEGHEVGCHTHAHAALDRYSRESFRDDLEANMAALLDAGATSVRGFRAPFFSLVAETEWAYETLAELGFEYSSSVLPADNPLYGWNGFGQQFRRIHGLWELPLTIARSRLLRIPFAGGIYFRVLPLWLTWRSFRQRFQRREAVVGYFHPQDVDEGCGRLRYASYNAFYNWLLNYNRSGCWQKLRDVAGRGCRILPYQAFVDEYLTT